MDEKNKEKLELYEKIVAEIVSISLENSTQLVKKAKLIIEENQDKKFSKEINIIHEAIGLMNERLKRIETALKALGEIWKTK